MWANDAWYTCVYTCTPQWPNLPFSMPRKAYGPECNSNRCTQRWCYPQQLCKGNGLGIGRGVVAAAVPMAGSGFRLDQRVFAGWFIVGPVWLKMCRIVTKHPGDAEESSPQLRFFHRFARFKTIHQSVFKHPKTKIRRQNSKSPAGRWRPTWWVTTLPWTPVPRARFPDNNMMFLACAVCLPGRWKYFKLEIPCLIHRCPSSTEVQLLRCSKKCIVYSRCVKYV